MADSSAQNQPNWQSFLNSDVPGLAKSQVLDNDNERALKHKSMAVPPPSDHSTDDPTSPSTHERYTCTGCQLPISGHFVRSLGGVYHIHCFKCADCQTPCSTKFFPYDLTVPDDVNGESSTLTTKTVPLCEHCYFKRLDLICHKCNGALRGSYITALGRKYHTDHFTCSLCSVVFGPEDSYYEHEDNIYCRYHYSTLYASKCEGCKTAILKQFVEINRGGRQQLWHPECYMINKFWNVMISPDSISAYPSENDTEQLAHDGQPENETKSLDSPTAESRDAVLKIEQAAGEKSFKIWFNLCGYEEATAACISDMLQYASSHKYNDALLATAKLVYKIEILLSALDVVVANIDPLINAMIEYDRLSKEEQDEEGEDYKKLIQIVDTTGFASLNKEPMTLCKKIVRFMLLLSKSRELGETDSNKLSQDLLESVSSMAHYLKLLIRYGLSNSLRYDRAFASGDLVTKFLDQVSKHEQMPANPLESLAVSGKTDDKCLSCKKSLEDDCAALDGKRWHLDCLQCKRCGRMLGSAVSDACYLVHEKRVVCSGCVEDTDGEVRDDFAVVTKLHQYIYLVKIALARLKLVLHTFDSRDKAALAAASEKKVTGVSSSIASAKPVSQSTHSLPENTRSTSDEYMSTLVDIRKNRSTRLSKQLSESSHRAKRSRVLAMPSSEHGLVDKNESTSSLVRESSAETSTAKEPGSPKSSTNKRPGFIKRIGSQKNRNRKPKIEEENYVRKQLGRTTDLLKNEKSLILDDIPRIVQAEQAKELLNDSKKTIGSQGNARSNSEISDSAKTDSSETAVAVKEGQKFMSDLTSTEIFYVRHIAIYLLHKYISSWTTTEELLDLIETRKAPSLWEKFGKAFSLNGNSGADEKKYGVFGVSLEVQVEKYGVDSVFGVGSTPLKIPAFVDECVSSMRQMDMSIEGIFRKNSNIRRSKELAELVDKNPGKTGMFVDENPIQLAALFKKYLRELPDSLLTFKLQKYWLKVQEVKDMAQRVRIMHLICCLLPNAHRDVVEVLFYFLNWTSTFAHMEDNTGSKMDIHNLSTVITPNVLYEKKKDSVPTMPTAESSEEFFLGIEAVDVLIREYSLFAHVPSKILSVLGRLDYNALSESTSIEILAKIDAVFKDLGGSVKEEEELTVPHVEMPKAAATRQPSTSSPVPNTVIPSSNVNYEQSGIKQVHLSN